MPRFYLHVRRGREVELDREGSEFGSLHDVEREALKAAAKVWAMMPPTADPNHFALEITDEDGTAVLSISFADALRYYQNVDVEIERTERRRA
jgi:hypothetical protein